MNLTKSQKKFIKRNLKEMSLSQIANRLNVSEADVTFFLRKKLDSDKFQKVIIKEPSSQTSSFFGNFTLKLLFIKYWKLLLFLFILVFGIYANSLNNEFLSDDLAGIVQEPNIKNPFYFLKNQPVNFLRYLNYSIIVNIFGMNQIFFRLANVLVHYLNSVIIFIILSGIFSPLVGLFGSISFASHPLLSESVTWITGGVHAQYAFFDYLAILLYILSRSKKWDKKYYLLSVISFFCALITTEKSSVLPFILVFYEFTLGNFKENIKRIIPYFIVGGAIVFYVFFGGMLSGRVSALQSQYYQEKGYYNPVTQIPIAITSYLLLTLWPDKLTLYHSEMIFTQPEYVLMFIATFALFAGIVYLFIKKNLRKYSFLIGFLIISLLPMLTPLKVAWIVAERYVYLGFFVIVGIMALLWTNLYEKVNNKRIVYLLFGLLIALWSGRTIIRNIDWKNQDNLWISADRTSPSSPQNHNNLGDMYSRHGDYPKAAEEFIQAVTLKPDYGDAYHNLANTYRLMNDNLKAEENYRKALKFNPNLWQSYQNLTVILYEKGNLAEAKETIQKAISLSPQNQDLRLIAGVVLMQMGDKENAKAELLKVLEINPNNEKAKEFLGKIN